MDVRGEIQLLPPPLLPTYALTISSYTLNFPWGGIRVSQIRFGCGVESVVL